LPLGQEPAGEVGEVGSGVTDLKAARAVEQALTPGAAAKLVVTFEDPN
jgi:Zn-dependent alcohol dehydrogenase